MLYEVITDLFDLERFEHLKKDQSKNETPLGIEGKERF